MFCELDIFRFFFFNDTATTEIYTLSLHDALPICARPHGAEAARVGARRDGPDPRERVHLVHDRDLLGGEPRSEEHTSELQSQSNLVCRLLLEKKKNKSANV